MKVLVINCGSSSLKFQLIDMSNESIIAKGNLERIATDGSFLKYEPKNADKIIIEKEIKNHDEAIKLVIDTLFDNNNGVIKDISEISAIGHRIVHGGEHFSRSVIIDDNVLKVIEDCVDIAPLHNPPNLVGIKACQKIMPNVPMVAVFDTAFHQTMPKNAYLYALPIELYSKYKIRRYGFHGTSHKYVSNRAISLLGKESSKIVTCHLGNGASVCAVKDGISVETSMGFTPLEGLVMGTRCGDIDPAIIPFIMEKENMGPKEINDYLNKKSGILGISGISNDFRDIEDKYRAGDENAKLTLQIFTQRVKKYICSYAGVMGGIDALVFTAGVGENSVIVRRLVVEGLEFLGIAIDKKKNNVHGKEIDISKDGSIAKTFVIPTNEELMIARDTKLLIQ